MLIDKSQRKKVNTLSMSFHVFSKYLLSRTFVPFSPKAPWSFESIITILLWLERIFVPHTSFSCGPITIFANILWTFSTENKYRKLVFILLLFRLKKDIGLSHGQEHPIGFSIQKFVVSLTEKKNTTEWPLPNQKGLKTLKPLKKIPVEVYVTYLVKLGKNVRWLRKQGKI